MPQFQLEGAGAPDFKSLPAFVRGYITAAFFTEASEGGDEYEGKTFGDITSGALAGIIADCEAFQAAAAPLLEEAFDRGYSEERAGTDFWFTRNGHGAGFWDREELAEAHDWTGTSLGNALSALCGFGTAFGEVDDLYPWFNS